MKEVVNQVKQYRVSDLRKHPNNPRIIKDNQYNTLKASIEANPELLEARPVILSDRTGKLTIIGGNQRFQVVKDLGWMTIPGVLFPDLSEEKERELMIRDNVSNGEWDFQILAADWDSAQLQEWGLDVPDWGDEEGGMDQLAGKIDQDETPEVQEAAVSMAGDLWVLGDHRLLCGDSTNADHISALMNGEKAALVFTDPPYGMKKEKDGVLNDNLNFNDLLEFNKKWIPLSFSALKDNGSWYCWGIDEPLMDIYSEILKPMMRENKVTFRNLLTWNKSNGQGQNSDVTRCYATADEKCLFVMCGVQGFNNNADNYFEGFDKIRDYLRAEKSKAKFSNAEINKYWSEKTNKKGEFDRSVLEHYWALSQWVFPTEENYKIIQAYCKENKINAFQREYDEIKREYDEIKREYDEIKREYYSTRAYFNNTHDNMNNVWNFARHKKDGSEGGHATPKPIELCERAIKSSSQENESVLDLFGGSGSTLIACEKTKRYCHMIELDQNYCDVIVRRWQNFTGRQAVLESTGQTFEEVKNERIS